MVALDSDDDSDGLEVNEEGFRSFEKLYKQKKSSSSDSDDDSVTPSASQILSVRKSIFLNWYF